MRDDSRAATDPETPKASLVVAQIGARMHYAVPEICVRNDLLHSFHTDIVAPGPKARGLSGLLGASPLARRYKGRTISDALRAKTTQYIAAGLWHNVRLKRARTLEARRAVFRAQAVGFGTSVARAQMECATGVFTYTSASREILAQTRTRGLHGFLEQYIASQPMRDALLTAERRRFSDWERVAEDVENDPPYRERLEAEWEMADTIVCPSDYVAQSLRDEGIASEKLAVVPYGVALPETAKPIHDPRGARKLRVLFVGTVELRKGVHYLAEALGGLPASAIETRIVGSSRLTETGLARLAQVADVVGRVPRAEIARQFEWADVFILPSLVEGSATVTYEALSHGVPVICTPNTGSIVADGETGLIVEPFSAPAISDALQRLIDEPDLAVALSQTAWARRMAASVERYEADLLRVFHNRAGASDQTRPNTGR